MKKIIQTIIPILLFWASFIAMSYVGKTPQSSFAEGWYGSVSVVGLLVTIAVGIALLVDIYTE